MSYSNHSALTSTLLVSVMLSLATNSYAAGEGTVSGTTVTINAETLTTNHVKNKSLLGGDLADNTITSLQIAPNAIGADELQNSAVDTLALQEGAVTNSKITNGTIQGGKIQPNTITNTNIALGTLSLDRFNDATQAIILSSATPNSITATELADNAVTTPKLANASVTGEKLAIGSIRASHITDGSIGMNHLAPDVKAEFQRFDTQLNQVNTRLDTHERGIAIGMAASNIPTVPDKDRQMGIGIASFGDTQAISARYQVKINNTTAFSMGGGLSEGTGAVNMGVGFGW